MVNELDLKLGDGQTLHVYDTGGDEGDARLAVLWHRRTNIGSPPAPLFPTAERLGLRWVSLTDPDTVAPPDPAGTPPRLPTSSRASPTRSASTGSQSWVTPVGGHARVRRAAAGSRPRRGQHGRPQLRSMPTGWTVRGHGRLGRGLAARSSGGSRAEKQRYEASGAEYDGVHPSR